MLPCFSFPVGVSYYNSAFPGILINQLGNLMPISSYVTAVNMFYNQNMKVILFTQLFLAHLAHSKKMFYNHSIHIKIQIGLMFAIKTYDV